MSTRAPRTRSRANVKPLPVTLNAISPGRISRRPGYLLTRKEAVAARALLNVEPGEGSVEALTSPATRDLVKRRFIRTTTARTPSGVEDVGWATPGAPPRAARRLIEGFNLGQAAVTALMRTADALSRPQEAIVTGPEVALAFAHRYQFTGVHALTITRTGEGIEVVEYRHHGPDRTVRMPASRVMAGELTVARPGLEIDDRRAHIPVSYLNTVATAYLNRTGTHRMHVDVDGVWVTTPDQHTPHGEAAGALRDGYPDWMPAIVADALDHLHVPATRVATPTAFTDWAETSLVLPLRCGPDTHPRLVNPHTGHTHAPDEAAGEAYAAHHLITSLTNRWRDGEVNACEGPHGFLTDPIGYEGFAAFRDEDLIRRLVCAAQYLDAGLDLNEAGDFLRFGLPPEHAVRLVTQRRRAPDAVTDLLFACVRDLNKRGTLQPALAAHLSAR